MLILLLCLLQMPEKPGRVQGVKPDPTLVYGKWKLGDKGVLDKKIARMGYYPVAILSRTEAIMHVDGYPPGSANFVIQQPTKKLELGRTAKLDGVYQVVGPVRIGRRTYQVLRLQ